MSAIETLVASNTFGHGCGVSGPFATSQGSQISIGGNGTPATLTFSNALTLASGTGISFDLSTLGTAHGGNNDQIVVGGALTVGGGNSIVINALGGAANLDQTTDYILFNGASSLSGTFNGGPLFVGTQPANFNHFIVTNDVVNKQVRLTYSAVAIPSISTAVTVPASGILRNQSVLMTVTVTPGAAPISSVNVNLSLLGWDLPRHR